MPLKDDVTACPSALYSDSNQPQQFSPPAIRSLEETRTLVKGVEICGGGKWADIKRLGFREIASRSPVDLKDKWRNLLRVALLPVEQIRLKKVSLFGSNNLLIPICATCRGQDGHNGWPQTVHIVL